MPMVREPLPERATHTGDAGAHLAAHCAVALGGFHLAAFPKARRSFENAIASYRAIDTAEAKRLAYEYGLDLGAVSAAYSAWCLWLLGFPDEALRMDDEGLEIAKRSGHDYTRFRGLYWSSVLHSFRREWPIVEARAAAAIATAGERGLSMVVAVGQIMQGVTRAMIEPSDDAVDQIRAALTAYRATGARFQITYLLVLLAQVLAARGRYREGLSAVREARAFAEETGERFVEAKMHRVEGGLLLAEYRSAEAESCYLRALELARDQEARSLELRAARDLAHLWAGGDRRAKARSLLAEVYNSFTEGFDTADLKDAKSLLDELG
jgi:predicted ATPase